jgi:hypothetical protein
VRVARARDARVCERVGAYHDLNVGPVDLQSTALPLSYAVVVVAAAAAAVAAAAER